MAGAMRRRSATAQAILEHPRLPSRSLPRPASRVPTPRPLRKPRLFFPGSRAGMAAIDGGMAVHGGMPEVIVGPSRLRRPRFRGAASHSRSDERWRTVRPLRRLLRPARRRSPVGGSPRNLGRRRGAVELDYAGGGPRMVRPARARSGPRGPGGGLRVRRNDLPHGSRHGGDVRRARHQPARDRGREEESARSESLFAGLLPARGRGTSASVSRRVIRRHLLQ